MNHDESEAKNDELRKRARAKVDSTHSIMDEASGEDVPRLLYELHTHQIELEMQNEELRHTQQELLDVRDRYILLYDLAPVGYLTISAKGLITEVNLFLASMLGIERQLLIRNPLSNHIASLDQDVYYRFHAQISKTKKPQSCELRMRARNHKAEGRINDAENVAEEGWFWVQLNSRPVFDSNGELHTVNLSVTDISEYKQAKEKLEHMATYDQLTHLPNRYLLETELNQRINAAERFEEKLAILFIDLDNFKVINDTMGHEQGDVLLQMVAKRISTHLREYDIVARFGGDEFVLIMPQVSANSDVVSVAEKINREFSTVFTIEKQEAFVTASIGISLFPDDGTTVGELLKNADAAMYRAKVAGRNRYCFFTRKMNDELRRHQFVASELRLALAHQDFCLYYQPQVDAQSGTISSCEALIRWFPGTDKQILPAEFIPIAEKSELINILGEWVIDEACRQRAEWKEMGLLDFRIDINLSGRQFLQKDIFLIIRRTLAKYHLTTADIGIELTENVLIEAGDSVLSNLRSLDEAGMQISIDDFGTGYSSLSYLRHFPVHILKIDQEFVSDAPQNEDDRSIMEAIVAVGHRLGLKVVVEGVETEEQHRLAQEIGCDMEQGFFFYKPMEASELYTLMSRQQEIA